MEGTISQLSPKLVWGYFDEICKIPRPSKKEEQIRSFLIDFALRNNFEYKTDETGNLLICKSATLGHENKCTVVLQSHLDMVCEKNSGTNHNFDVDPIRPRIEGEWVKATGTTLGADCGIGIAVQMAVLTDTSLIHGPLECLFTVDEETGLTGAFALESGFFTGKTLINLDSEDEGQLFIGCAGGIDTIGSLPIKKEESNSTYFPLVVKVHGLKGGHSGDDINKGRGNAIKILNRFLWEAYHNYGIKLAYIDGGNLRNAIAREAEATILIQKFYKENLVADFNILKHQLSEKYSITEPDLNMELGSTDFPKMVFDDISTEKLLNILYACPHGVQSMSYKMPGMVETSTNLASVKLLDNDQVLITTSQRSDNESCKKDIAAMVETVFLMGGATIAHSDGYPGWSPNPSSKILAITVDAYKHLFHVEPLVRSIHAGLECGLFLKKYPGLDMVSFGPTILGAHSPDERIEISTVEKFWLLLKKVLQDIPNELN